MQLSIEIDELFLSGNSCKSCGNSSVGSLCSHCQKICFHVKNNEVSSSILLTQVEKMPIMSVYRLPQGQYGYSGHVVNLPQDVASFVQSLPHLPSELDVIVVRKEGANQSHRDFRVRRAVVHRALQWLVTHNQYYHSLANNLYQPRTSVKLYSSSVDTPLKLLE